MAVTPASAWPAASRSPAVRAVLPARTVVVQHGQCLRDVEVIVHGHPKGLRDRTSGCIRSRVGQDPACAAEEAVDPFDGGGGLLQRRRLVVQDRAVLRLAEVVPDHARRGDLEHFRRADGVADGLGHLLAGVGDHAVVHPEVGEAVACRLGLRHFVFVVREAQVQAAAVDVELGAEVLGDHRRAFEVPARAAGAPRAKTSSPSSARRPCSPSTARSRGGPSCRAGRRPGRPACRRVFCRVSEPYLDQERTSK